MALIKTKNDRRCRIQFTMDRQLFLRYQATRTKAKALGLSIKFKKDFQGWFSEQLLEIDRVMEEMTSREGANEK